MSELTSHPDDGDGVAVDDGAFEEEPGDNPLSDEPETEPTTAEMDLAGLEDEDQDDGP